MIQLLLCIAMLVTNSLAIIALWKAKMMRVQIKMPLMMVAVSDFLTGINLGYFRLVALLEYGIQEELCRVIFLILIFTTYTVHLTLSTLSLDRCLCLYMEMQYIKHMTPAKTIIIYIMVSIIGLGISLIKNSLDFQGFTVCRYESVIGSTHKEFFIAFGQLVRAVSFVSFLFLYKKIKGIISKTAPLGMQGFSTRFFGSATKCVVIAVTFQVMYLPFGVNEIISLVRPDLTNPGSPLFYVGSLCILLNSVINPLLYGLRFRECRIELQKILCIWNTNFTTKLNTKLKCIQAPYLDHARY